jgi:hypothetical protein
VQRLAVGFVEVVGAGQAVQDPGGQFLHWHAPAGALGQQPAGRDGVERAGEVRAGQGQGGGQHRVRVADVRCQDGLQGGGYRRPGARVGKPGPGVGQWRHRVLDGVVCGGGVHCGTSWVAGVSRSGWVGS